MPPTILQASIISSFSLKYKIGVIFFRPYISFLAGAFLCTLILTGDGTPCVFQETSLVVLIEALSFGPVTGVSSSLIHSTPVSQVKRGLNVIICCWDGQDDFFTPSHPWVIFISFWLHWISEDSSRVSCGGVSGISRGGERRNAFVIYSSELVVDSLSQHETGVCYCLSLRYDFVPRQHCSIARPFWSEK